MGLSRRNALIGLGTLIAGGGALLGTGAFTTVEAQRTVTVETAGDGSAFLGLSPSNGPNGNYADGSGDTLEINLGSQSDGLNKNAKTKIRNIVTVANNGNQDVGSLTLEFTNTPNNVDPDATFDFTVDDGGNQDKVENGADILTGNNGVTDTLNSGNSINFGIEVDLINGGNNGDLPTNGDYTLTIIADSA